jgi:signal transduction histidine kinase
VNSFEILRLALFGFWMPFALVAIGYLFWRRLEAQRRSHADYELRMMERDRSERTAYEVERKEAEMRSTMEFLQKSFESRLEDLGPQIRNTVESVLGESLVRHSRSPALVGGGTSTGNLLQQQSPDSDSALLIREISHALNTPLSHIEAGLITLDSQAAKLQQPDLQEHLAEVLTGVQTCKSVIAGFREVILATRSMTTWSPTSLSVAVSSIGRVLAEAAGRGLSVDVRLPATFQEFSNNYLVAVLLPLIENAVESSARNTTITVSSRQDEGFLFLDVTSTPVEAPESNQIYVDGFTTKLGHTGTGLSIVQRLISGRRGAKIAHKLQGTAVTFTVKLPM